MGTQNLVEYSKRIEKFKDNLCPICDNEISINNLYKPLEDCIHYECSTCSPLGAIISISGSVLASDTYKKILYDATVKAYLQDKILKFGKGEIVQINSTDFSQP